LAITDLWMVIYNIYDLFKNLH